MGWKQNWLFHTDGIELHNEMQDGIEEAFYQGARDTQMRIIASLSELDGRDREIFTIYNEVQLKRIYEPGRGIFIAESPKVILF